MAQPLPDGATSDAVELLGDNGSDALAEAVTVLPGNAMVAERSAYPGTHGAPFKAVKQRLAPHSRTIASEVATVSGTGGLASRCFSKNGYTEGRVADTAACYRPTPGPALVLATAGR